MTDLPPDPLQRLSTRIAELRDAADRLARELAAAEREFLAERSGSDSVEVRSLDEPTSH